VIVPSLTISVSTSICGSVSGLGKVDVERGVTALPSCEDKNGGVSHLSFAQVQSVRVWQMLQE
jgi:hypothetical protein